MWGKNETNESGEIGSDVGHLLEEVVMESALVLAEVDDALGKVHDAGEVELGDLVTHGRLGRLDDLGDLGIVLDDLAEFPGDLVVEELLLADRPDAARVRVIVGDDSDEFREVPRIPLAHAHRQSVHVLLQLVKKADALDDHVISPVHVELHLAPAVAVPQPQLRLSEVSFLQFCVCVEPMTFVLLFLLFQIFN